MGVFYFWNFKRLTCISRSTRNKRIDIKEGKWLRIHQYIPPIFWSMSPVKMLGMYSVKSCYTCPRHNQLKPILRVIIVRYVHYSELGKTIIKDLARYQAWKVARGTRSSSNILYHKIMGTLH
ncbi:hypothetical protein AMTRI_Chr13g83040 [Amborella trichopoda]